MGRSVGTEKADRPDKAPDPEYRRRGCTNIWKAVFITAMANYLRLQVGLPTEVPEILLNQIAMKKLTRRQSKSGLGGVEHTTRPRGCEVYFVGPRSMCRALHMRTFEVRADGTGETLNGRIITHAQKANRKPRHFSQSPLKNL